MRPPAVSAAGGWYVPGYAQMNVCGAQRAETSSPNLRNLRIAFNRASYR
jgi:hypothetical protein